MKKIIPFILAMVIASPVFSQSMYIVTGKVINAETKLPMVPASVFAENTTIGTVTDAEGNFRLQLPNGGYNLVITYTGFQTEAKRITTASADDKDIVFEMKLKQKEMEDVVVKATYEVANGWEKYGDFFLDNFIGKTANSKECVINNASALKFFFYKRRNRLKVLATAPLEIVNNALGYKIKYELDSFTHEYNTEVSLYTGYPLFEEMKPANEEQRVKWETNRLKAYHGSILHFMRSLYQKKLKEEGFEIQFLIKFKDIETATAVKNFYGAMNYSKDDSTQTVEVWPNQNEVAVIYKNEKPEEAYQLANPDQPAKFQLSVFSFIPKESIIIEQNGYYFEQTELTINQYLSWEKMADMLPYDFKVK